LSASLANQTHKNKCYELYSSKAGQILEMTTANAKGKREEEMALHL